MCLRLQKLFWSETWASTEQKPQTTNCVVSKTADHSVEIDIVYLLYTNKAAVPANSLSAKGLNPCPNPNTMGTRSRPASSGLPLLQLPDSFLYKLCQDHLEAADTRTFMQCSTACANLAVVTHRSQPLLHIRTDQVKHWEALRGLLGKLPKAEIFVRWMRVRLATRAAAVNPCDLLFGLCNIPGQPAPVQPYTCIALLCLKGLTLPSLLPDNVAAMCPYIVWLHLTDCRIQPSQSGSNRVDVESAIGAHLECMHLTSVHTRDWVTSMGGNADERARRITRMFPSLLRLDLDDCHSPESLLLALSSQLINCTLTKAAPDCMESVLTASSTMTKLTCLRIDELRPHTENEFGDNYTTLEIDGFRWISPLQYLGRLEVPNTVVDSYSLQHLLALPWLAAVCVHSFELGEADFSQHPCVWRELSMQSNYVSIRCLGQLPLRTVDHGLWVSPAAHAQVPQGDEDRQTLKLILPGGPDALQALQKSQQNLYHCPSFISYVFEWRANNLDLEFDGECTAEDQAAVLEQFNLYPKAASYMLPLTLKGMHITPQTLAALFDERKTSYSRTAVILDFVDCPADYTDAATWKLLAHVPRLSVFDHDGEMKLSDYLSMLRLLAQFKKEGEEPPYRETHVHALVDLEQTSDMVVAQEIEHVPVPDHINITLNFIETVGDQGLAGVSAIIKAKDASTSCEESLL